MNALLFLGASLIVIYFLGLIFRKQNYLIRFIIITFIILAIILGYSYLEKLSILSGYREPIFSIKEIYKEYNVTIYDSFFYDAYSCDFTSNEISMLGDRKVEDACANDKSFKGTITLKSGATISEQQLQVLMDFREELLKLGFVDYNYMRQEDLNIFWNYMDETNYCSVNNLEYSDLSLYVKRKNGICQYHDKNYYYCVGKDENGTTTYTKAINGSCN